MDKGTPIACVGGAHFDRKARLAGPYRPGTSNPVTVSATQGGVARNVAEALARLGHQVSLFTALGADTDGDTLLAALGALSIDVECVYRAGAPTGSYTAIIEPDGNLVRGLADMEIYDALDPDWANAVAEELSRHPIWIVDANLPQATLQRLLAARGSAWVFANAVSAAKAERLRPVLAQLDAIFADRAEAEVLCGFAVESPEDGLRAARKIRAAGPQTVVISLGAEGVAVARANEERVYAEPSVLVADVTGAGDALLAGYVHGMLVAGADKAVRFGLAAAGMALASDHAVPPGLTPARLAHAANLTRAAE